MRTSTILRPSSWHTSFATESRGRCCGNSLDRRQDGAAQVPDPPARSCCHPERARRSGRRGICFLFCRSKVQLLVPIGRGRPGPRHTGLPSRRQVELGRSSRAWWMDREGPVPTDTFNPHLASIPKLSSRTGETRKPPMLHFSTRGLPVSMANRAWGIRRLPVSTEYRAPGRRQVELGRSVRAWGIRRRPVSTEYRAPGRRQVELGRLVRAWGIGLR
jgi:hypothetical protein